MQSAPEGESIACFDGFAWPLPLAFASAVAASRFELGDVLYSDPIAYRALKGSFPKGSKAIQVLHSPRGASGAHLEPASDRRSTNWRTEVSIELADLDSGASEQRTISQGKLFMALWKGDETWLGAERAEPEPPKSARQLHGQLAEARPVLAAHAASIGIGAGAGSQFVLVVDLAGDASRAKANLVAEELGAMGRMDVVDLGPAAAGIEDPDRYHPTLVIRAFSVEGHGVDELESQLRSCLYRGGQGDDSSPPAACAEEGSGPPGDRFSIGRHGLLVEL